MNRGRQERPHILFKADEKENQRAKVRVIGPSGLRKCSWHGRQSLCSRLSPKENRSDQVVVGAPWLVSEEGSNREMWSMLAALAALHLITR